MLSARAQLRVCTLAKAAHDRSFRPVSKTTVPAPMFGDPHLFMRRPLIRVALPEVQTSPEIEHELDAHLQPAVVAVAGVRLPAAIPRRCFMLAQAAPGRLVRRMERLVLGVLQSLLPLFQQQLQPPGLVPVPLLVFRARPRADRSVLPVPRFDPDFPDLLTQLFRFALQLSLGRYRRSGYGVGAVIARSVTHARGSRAHAAKRSGHTEKSHEGSHVVNHFPPFSEERELPNETHCFWCQFLSHPHRYGVIRDTTRLTVRTSQVCVASGLPECKRTGLTTATSYGSKFQTTNEP